MSERRLRILLVGASGTLGRAVAAELAQRHEVIAAGRRSGSIQIDLTDVDSILRGLKQAGELDAVISAAGSVTFAPLAANRCIRLASPTSCWGR
jgi:nucleoside-diphosphate-sugar epimerase